MGEKGRKDSVALDLIFIERVSSFSLSFCTIRLLAVFGARRKTALRGECFMWVPDLWSLDQLLEVGVSPYLGFILSLKAMLMFELNEAMRGRLIGPKSWDQIVIIFGAIFCSSRTVCVDCVGCLCHALCIKSCCDVYEAGIGREIRVHQVNR